MSPALREFSAVEEENLGRICYEAYADAVEWKSVRGDPLPAYNDLIERVQDAWQDAAEAVAEHLEK
jgi:precorrin-2 methylase